ncbi:hypothetical protein K239x_43840 [Planctomycetes bacterium K23_9]|uniref:Uncharacterized protein n=1 Tax=Stieleria marina TaxID=1930275 RepID=A0A517NZ13_9BACT|nr:hypothetical protein K239x_43840 [Planctomycetes bacterium K23_9]
MLPLNRVHRSSTAERCRSHEVTNVHRERVRNFVSSDTKRIGFGGTILFTIDPRDTWG